MIVTYLYNLYYTYLSKHLKGLLEGQPHNIPYLYIKLNIRIIINVMNVSL